MLVGKSSEDGQQKTGHQLGSLPPLRASTASSTNLSIIDFSVCLAVYVIEDERLKKSTFFRSGRSYLNKNQAPGENKQAEFHGYATEIGIWTLFKR